MTYAGRGMLAELGIADPCYVFGAKAEKKQHHHHAQTMAQRVGAVLKSRSLLPGAAIEIEIKEESHHSDSTSCKSGKMRRKKKEH